MVWRQPTISLTIDETQVTATAKPTKQSQMRVGPFRPRRVAANAMAANTMPTPTAVTGIHHVPKSSATYAAAQKMGPRKHCAVSRG